ncbi:MAG TPA: pyridoxal-phosphate dependent enzyme, partial [Anaerolineales bacterium]|nr:pyridoxal-phosphate dependent enzyme [Anaerolineales bacterium]
MNNKFLGYRCSLCASEYGPTDVTYVCPKDGGNLDLLLDLETLRAKFQPADIESRADPSLWRYLPLLPVAEVPGSMTPLHAAGGTPVFSLARIADRTGLENVWLKDESRNPTASFKDRASAIVVARASEIGAEIVITASTGNAGAALAGMAAAVGQKAIV